MRQAWGEFLASAKPRSHGAQVYAETSELVASVASYAVAGFERDEPALLIAVPEHVPLFSDAFAAGGWDADTAQEAGLLLVADAEATLASILDGAGPSPARFDKTIGALLDAVERPGQRTRVFGEMVDVLAKREAVAGAAELEGLWNDLAARRDFSLLCGYHLDIFDHATQVETLPDVCREHSHVLPARNYPRFAGAVDEALWDVLGAVGAAEVYVYVTREADEREESHIPLAELLLMWVARNRPQQSPQVLEVARQRFARAA